MLEQQFQAMHINPAAAAAPAQQVRGCAAVGGCMGAAWTVSVPGNRAACLAAAGTCLKPRPDTRLARRRWRRPRWPTARTPRPPAGCAGLLAAKAARRTPAEAAAGVPGAGSGTQKLM